MNSKTIPEYARENGYEAYQTGKITHNLKKGMWTQKGIKNDYGPFPYNGKKTCIHPNAPKAMEVLGAIDSTFQPLTDIPTVNDYTGWVNHSWSQGISPFRYINDDDRDKMTDEKSLDFFRDKMKKLEKNNNAKPFFFAVGIVRPHTPLVVPQKYYDKFPIDSIELNIKKGDKEDCKDGGGGRGREAMDALIGDSDKPEFMLKKYLQAYLASVAFADEIVGGVVDTIEQSRFNENTIIILFSDHGYQLGEKDSLWKYTLWEDTTRVPLIIKHPKYTQNAGKTVNHPVSLIDIFPTIKDACKMTGDTKINANGVNLDGHSLMPFVANPENGKWTGPDIALTTLDSYKSKRPRDQHVAARSKDFRYIRYADGGEELYDHRKDPNEWNNQATNPEYSEIKKQLQKQLNDLLSKAQNPKAIETKKTPEASASNWKDAYFKKYPEADTNKDGELSWPEFHQHKKTVNKG